MSVTTRQRQTHSPLSGHPEHAPAASPDLAPPATWYLPARDVLELGVALVLLTLAAPVIVLLAALVKLTGRDFGYDTPAWRRWLRTSFQPDPAPARRVPQP